MQEFHHSNCDPKLLSPGTLAFLGDAVYELFVRQNLVETANMPVNKLHLLAVEKVAKPNFSSLPILGVCCHAGLDIEYPSLSFMYRCHYTTDIYKWQPIMSAVFL